MVGPCFPGVKEAGGSWPFQEGSRKVNVGGGVRGGTERGFMPYAVRGPPKEVNARGRSRWRRMSSTTRARQLTPKTIAAGWEGGPGKLPIHSNDEAVISEVLPWGRLWRRERLK